MMTPTLADSAAIWWQHVGVVAAFTAVLLWILFWVRDWRDAAKVRWFEIGFALVGLAISAIVNTWWLLPGRFSWQESLPIQMCDLAGVVAPLALLTRARWLLSLLHFWGLGLCSQWVCTPVAQAGPAKIEFWMSFILHASILGSAACAVLIGGYRPNWRDWGIGMWGAFIYTLAMLPLDIWLGANYGYVGATRPNATTILDVLGPWPLRLIWIAVLAIAAMTLVRLAWYPLGRLQVFAVGSAAHPVDRMGG